MIFQRIFSRAIVYEKNLSRFRFYSNKIHPVSKTWDIISNDIPDFFGRKRKDVFYPEHTDIVIIGGGFVGSSAAYWLKTRAGEGLSIVVIEKDLTYENTQKHMPLGVITQHYSLPENIYLSQHSAEFLRNIKENLNSDVDIQYCPSGCLVLASEKYADKLEQNIEMQREHGLRNELLSIDEINKRYPWINTHDVKLGSISYESEGTFNSWALLKGLTKKSKDLGTKFVNAEVTGFELEHQRDVLMEGVAPGSYHRINKVVFKTPDNEEHSIKFAICILAAGHQSGEIAKLAKIGTSSGLLSIPLPISKREQKVYSIEEQASVTGLNTPLVMDTSGLWLRRNGLENNLLCGHLPLLTDEAKPISENEFFTNFIKPSLFNRVPSCINTQVNSFKKEVFDYNTYDDSGIMGPHPYHNNLYIAAGFGKLGCQHASGIGRAIAELVIDSQYVNIDLTRLGFDRMMTNQPLIEFNVY